MRQLFKALTSSGWLLLCLVLVATSADAQKRYPSIEEAWDGTDYRAVIQRVETDGLELPTLADAATKPVFERMVREDNIPLRVGLNAKLSVTIRFQKLSSALHPVQKLVTLYSNEMQKGKPYAAEVARLMLYEAKIAGMLLDLSDPYLSSLAKDKRYQMHVDDHNQMKGAALQLYSGLVQRMTETSVYTKPDILAMSRGALEGLRSYDPIITDPHRQELVQRLTQQISATTDQELKSALSALRDAIKKRQIPT
jgi:hypothetical protein